MQRLGGLYEWGQESQRERQFDFEIRITEMTKKRQLCQWLFVVIT